MNNNKALTHLEVCTFCEQMAMILHSGISILEGLSDAIAQGVKSAVTYPLIMIGMMLLIVVVLLVKVMPIFNQVFLQLGTEMTGFSRGILTLGTVLSQYAAVFILLLALLLGAILYLSKSHKGRRLAKTWAAHFILTRGLNEKIAMGRFAAGLAMTIASGLSGEESLSLAAQITEHPAILAKLTQAQAAMAQGQSLSEALLSAHLFSGVYAKVLSIGDKSGSMDEAMDQIATQYSEEVDQSIEGTLSVLEPTLVAILSVMVGLILLSVMFPLLGIFGHHE